MPYEPSVPCAACSRGVDPLRAACVLGLDHERKGTELRLFCSADCRRAFRTISEQRGRSRFPTPASIGVRGDEVAALHALPATTSSPPPSEVLNRKSAWLFAPIALACGFGFLPGTGPVVIAAVLLFGAAGWLLIRPDPMRSEAGPFAAWSGPVGSMALALAAVLSEAHGALVVTSAAGLVLCWMRSLLALRGKRALNVLLSDLRASVPERSRMSLPDLDDGRPIETRESATSSVRTGEELLVEAGDVIPVDGVISAGEAQVIPYPAATEAILRTAPSSVLAGARVVSGSLRVTSTRVGEARALFRPRTFGQEGAPGSASLTRFATWAKSPISAALFLLTTAGFVVMFRQGAASMLAGLGTTLLSMPVLSLVLGAKWPFVSASALAASRGVVFRDASALERAGRVSAAAFCTDGTVTHGDCQLVEVSPLGRPQEAAELTALAMGAEIAAEPHPIALAVRRFGEERGVTPTALRRAAYTAGRGVTALVDGGAALVIGNRQSLLQEGVSVAVADREAQRAESQGRTVVFLAVGGRARALFVFEDPVRPEARAAVQQLIDLDVEVLLLSGDHRATVEALARTLDITHVKAELPSDERAAEVGRLREAGGIVAVIGRAPADETSLAMADVALTLDAAGSTMEGDLAVASGDVRDAAWALSIARSARRTAQGVVTATIVGGASLSISAAIGVLHPLIALLAAGLIDAWALPSAARLLRGTRRRGLR